MTTISASDVPQVLDLPEDARVRAPIVEGDNTLATVTDKIAKVTESTTPRGWYILFGISVACILNLFGIIGYLVWTGIGVWGNNNPVAWGFPIVSAAGPAMSARSPRSVAATRPRCTA